MDMDTFSQLISTIGFPILAYMIMVKSNHDLQERHTEEMKAMTDALDNNTQVLQALRIEFETINQLSNHNE